MAATVVLILLLHSVGETLMASNSTNLYFRNVNCIARAKMSNKMSEKCVSSIMCIYIYIYIYIYLVGIESITIPSHLEPYYSDYFSL